MYNFKIELKNLRALSKNIFKIVNIYCRDTLPEETIKIETTFTPTLKGKFALVAIFFSKELQEVLGAADIDVA